MVTDIEKKFVNWWASLQPQWRLLENGKVDSSLTDGDWDDLRKPGLNGLYSVLVALFYWGSQVGKGSAECDRWMKAVEDVQLALDCMAKETSLSGG